MIIVWRRFTSTVETTVKKQITCQKCKKLYGYTAKRQGIGVTKTYYNIGNSSAAQSARQKAEANLKLNVEKDVDIVHCPSCGWLQDDMVETLRKRLHSWAIPGSMFVGLPGLMILFASGSHGPMSANIATMLIGGLLTAGGVGLLVWRFLAQKSFDPNVESQARAGKAIAGVFVLGPAGKVPPPPPPRIPGVPPPPPSSRVAPSIPAGPVLPAPPKPRFSLYAWYRIAGLVSAMVIALTFVIAELTRTPNPPKPPVGTSAPPPAQMIHQPSPPPSAASGRPAPITPPPSNVPRTPARVAPAPVTPVAIAPANPTPAVPAPSNRPPEPAVVTTPHKLSDDLVYLASFDRQTIVSRDGRQMLQDVTSHQPDQPIFGTTIVDGKFGEALHLDGHSDYVDLSSTQVAGDGNAPRTITCWVKSSGLGVNVISTGTLHHGEAFNLQLGPRTPGIVGIMGFSNDFYPKTGMTVGDGKWHFVAVVLDSQLQTFVDGKPDGLAPEKLKFQTRGQSNFIGKSNDTHHARWYAGDLDDLAVWKRALSNGEISQIYGAGVAGMSLQQLIAGK